MNNIERIERDVVLSDYDEKALVKRLREFSCEKDIDEAFQHKKIKTHEDKIYYLQKCSGFDESFNVPSYQFLTPQEKYIHELSIFVEKLWEVSSLYEGR